MPVYSKFHNPSLYPLRIYENEGKFYLLDNENVVHVPINLLADQNMSKSWFDTRKEAQKELDYINSELRKTA